jgi:hypothetical protein
MSVLPAVAKHKKIVRLECWLALAAKNEARAIVKATYPAHKRRQTVNCMTAMSKKTGS